MEKKCGIFVVKMLHFSKFLDLIWTWTLCLKNVWTTVGLGLSFNKSGLDDSPLISGLTASKHAIMHC